MFEVNGVPVAVPPPSGYTVNFEHPQRQCVLESYIIAGIGMGVASFFMVQRFYVHYHLRNNLSFDDCMYYGQQHPVRHDDRGECIADFLSSAIANRLGLCYYFDGKREALFLANTILGRIYHYSSSYYSYVNHWSITIGIPRANRLILT